MKIFELWGSVLVDTKGAEDNLVKTDNKILGVANKLADGVAKAAAFGTALVGAATGAMASVMALTEKTAEYADKIDKLSERTGINREELQRWKYAAEQSGGDIEKLEVGIKKLSDVMDAASNGNATAIKSFRSLGITTKELKESKPEEIFEKVMNSLGDMEQSARRNALGNDLLGKSYTELLPLLNAGSQGMSDLKARADQLGLVMSDSNVRANAKFGDTMADIRNSMSAVTMAFTNALLPGLQRFADWVISNMPQIQKAATNVGQQIGPVFESLGKVLVVLANNFGIVKAAALILFPILMMFKVVGLIAGLFSLLGISQTTQAAAATVATGANTGAAFSFRILGQSMLGALPAILLIVGAIAAVTIALSALRGQSEKPINLGISEAASNEMGRAMNVMRVPNIPGLRKGGTVVSAGRVLVGEDAPEILDLPSGARVTPLDHKSGTTTNNYNVQVSARDAMEFKNVIDFFNSVPRLARG